MKNQIIQYWRVLACICIVYHHSVCLISGGWPPFGYSLLDNIPNGIEYLSSQSKAFGLMGFTFISGAVLAYANKKQDSFILLLWKKIKRIILPALIFGGLYWLLFPTLMFDTWPAPINGTHLWYLPMIFICIILTSAHLYSKNALLWIVPIFFIIRKVAMFADLRTLNEFLYYYPIFYSGYIVNCLLYCPNKFRNSLLQFTRFNYIILGLIIFLSILLFSKVCARVNGISNVPIAIYMSVGYLILLKMMQYNENVPFRMGGVKYNI